MMNVMETDCFVDALQFLGRSLPFSEIVHPESEAVTNYGTSLADAWANAQHSFATTFKDACRGKVWESTYQIMDRREKKAQAAASAETGESTDQDGTGTGDTKPRLEYPNVLMLCGSAGSPLKVIQVINR